MSDARDARPWYAQAVLWLTLSPLIVTVIAGLWLIVTSTELGGVDALPGEYGKAGKLIALDERALRRSRTLAPVAGGSLDPAAGRLRITIAAPELPPKLAARLIHATLPERDVVLELARDGDGWTATLPAAIPDRGELHVHPDDRSWRLVAPISTDPLRFEPSRR